MTVHDRFIAELMAAFGAVGGLVHGLPVLATVLAALWYGIQIYDRFRGRRDRHPPDS